MTLKSDLKKASYTVLEPTLIGGTTFEPIRLMPNKYISFSALKKICEDYCTINAPSFLAKDLVEVLSELEQEEKK